MYAAGGVRTKVAKGRDAWWRSLDRRKALVATLVSMMEKQAERSRFAIAELRAMVAVARGIADESLNRLTILSLVMMVGVL